AASDHPPTPSDLQEYARRYPDAAGALAGRKGTYATILVASLATDHLERPGQTDGGWPTFAGSSRRTRVVPAPIDVGQVQWRRGARSGRIQPANGRRALLGGSGAPAGLPPDRAG